MVGCLDYPHFPGTLNIAGKIIEGTLPKGTNILATTWSPSVSISAMFPFWLCAGALNPKP